MCGLYGVITPTRHPLTIHDSLNLSLLAEQATERGHDSAGYAARTDDAGWSRRLTLTPASLRFPATPTYAVIGHTRHATQGAISLRTASPLSCGTLLGTHNGDVDIDSLDHHYVLPHDTTDSAHLFAALAPAHARTRFRTAHVVRVLTNMRGRAALAWTDTAHPSGRVWLARAGLSPLAVGLDDLGRLWWASNPEWLEAIGVEDTWLLDEGTLWRLTPQAHSVNWHFQAAFKPTIRSRDLRLHRAVWRSFSPERAATYAAARHHRVGA
ncbi:hypothetical protein GCM10027418_04870 [Mariniluteicoccus endophyticus]